MLAQVFQPARDVPQHAEQHVHGGRLNCSAPASHRESDVLSEPEQPRPARLESRRSVHEAERISSAVKRPYLSRGTDRSLAHEECQSVVDSKDRVVAPRAQQVRDVGDAGSRRRSQERRASPASLSSAFPQTTGTPPKEALTRRLRASFLVIVHLFVKGDNQAIGSEQELDVQRLASDPR